jgi:CheY-like chemotaxis protein
MSGRTIHVLVVDDQENWRSVLRFLLEKEGLYVSEAKNSEEAKDKLAHKNFDLALLDVKLEDDQVFNVEGLDLLNYIKINYPNIKVIVLTGYPKSIGNKKPEQADEFILKAAKDSNFKEDFQKKIKTLLQIIINEDDKILKLLIFDDELNDVFNDIFLHSNYHLDITTDIEKAKRQIKDYDGAIINLCLSNQLSSEKNSSSEMLLSYIKSKYPFLPRFVVTASSINSINRLFNEFGVDNVFIKGKFSHLKAEMDKTISNRKKKVFISYAKEDYNIAKRLYNDLIDIGAYPWLAREELIPGEIWKDKITKVIKRSNYFLTLLSHKSVSKSGFFQTEQKTALEVFESMPKGQIFIIPARLDACEAPETLENIHYVDLFPSYEEGFKKILKSLNS